MNRILFTLLCILFSSFAFAQNEADNWNFGFGAALNFSTCEPVVVTGSKLNTLEGCTSISNAAGQLLFYSDGVTVWNKNNQVMLNGTGLFGDPSSTQSGVVFPQPGNDSIYYLFTVDARSYQTSGKGLRYSVINIHHDNGNGEVIQKNIPLLAAAQEKVTGVRHADRKDIWIITRKTNSDQYYAWLLTGSGIAALPVISSTGNVVMYHTLGYLKSSPDGKTIACALYANSFWELSKFDAASGIISNTLNISSKPLSLNTPLSTSVYGIEFSPSGKYIYTSTLKSRSAVCGDCMGFVSFIHQYDISNFDLSAISNSVAVIDSAGSPFAPVQGNCYGGMQLAKNRRMYISQVFVNKLSVVNKPDLPFPACDFQRQTVDLGAGLSGAGFPTFIQSFFDPAYRQYDFDFTHYCDLKDSFHLITTVPYDSLRWDFGDPASGSNNTSLLANPQHIFSNAGEKKVRLFVFNVSACVKTTDTIEKKINVQFVTKPRSILNVDTALCAGETIILGNGDNSYSYLWQDGSAGSTYTVTQPGIYNVTAVNQCGSSFSEIKIRPGICGIYIPAAFTPNGDGKNDVFRATGDNINIYTLQVYNRYGQLIFQTSDKRTGWDGTFKGKIQPSGAYTWMIRYNFYNKPALLQQTGTVLLVQ